MSPSPASGPEAGSDPGPLVSVAWLRKHLSDPDLRLVHVSPEPDVYAARHLPGAVFSPLHEELGLRGRRPETGDAEREWLVPSPEELTAAAARWGVEPGDRVVFYDDVGQNRHAIRGFWLLRMHGWPRERVHVLDGGLNTWERARLAMTSAVPPARTPLPVRFVPPDPAFTATFEEVREWSDESVAGEDAPIRILDVRTAEEHRGDDVRARRGGRIPGAAHLLWSDFLNPDDTFRSVEEIRALADHATGGDASSLRAVHCQGGIRAALAWFALHELAGLSEVRNYAGSWEEWGNRRDAPIASG